MKNNFDKTIELGILTKVKNGYTLSPEWQKLMFQVLKKAAKQWHNNGRKGNLDWFSGVEKLVTDKFPNEDQLVQVELAYYAYEVANHAIKEGVKK